MPEKVKGLFLLFMFDFIAFLNKDRKKTEKRKEYIRLLSLLLYINVDKTK